VQLNLRISFTTRTIEGGGSDEIGKFTIEGEFSRNNRVFLRKKYDGRHSVNYEGQAFNSFS